MQRATQSRRRHVPHLGSLLVALDFHTKQSPQQEKVDLKNFEIYFSAISGDFEVFEGSWKLIKVDEHSTKVIFSLRVKIGIPQIEEVIGELLTDRLKSVFHAMLDCLP